MNDRSDEPGRFHVHAAQVWRAWQRDTLTIGVVAGTVATTAFVLLDWVLVRLVGLNYSAAWEYTAEMFLNAGLVHTPMGRLIGYLGEFMMGMGFGVNTATVLRLTGKDNYLLKGSVTAGVWFVALLVLLPRWLRTATWIYGQPFTILMALKNWVLMAVIDSFIVARYAEFSPAEFSTKPVASGDTEAAHSLERTFNGLQATFVEFSGEVGELSDKLERIVDRKTKRREAEPASDGENHAQHRRPRIVKVRKR